MIKEKRFGLHQLWSGFKDIIYPPFCLVCNKKLSQGEQVVCGQCWDKLIPTHLGNWQNEVTHKEGLDYVLTGWFFDEVFQNIIHSLKYKEMRIVAKELGLRLGKMFLTELQYLKLDVVIPVPLHPAKLRSRGFNQSDLIGKSLAKVIGVPYDLKILKRTKNTQSQTTLGIGDRKLNVSEAFSVSSSPPYKRYLIVDDVLTTGATLAGCAFALREKKAEFIAVITSGTPKIEA